MPYYDQFMLYGNRGVFRNKFEAEQSKCPKFAKKISKILPIPPPLFCSSGPFYPPLKKRGVKSYIYIHHCTVCPGSSDPFYIVRILYKMGHYFLDIQYEE